MRIRDVRDSFKTENLKRILTTEHFSFWAESCNIKSIWQQNEIWSYADKTAFYFESHTFVSNLSPSVFSLQCCFLTIFSHESLNQALCFNPPRDFSDSFIKPAFLLEKSFRCLKFRFSAELIESSLLNTSRIFCFNLCRQKHDVCGLSCWDQSISWTTFLK